MDHGVAAIIVSNHGGRMLDGCIASLAALPAIADAVSGDVDVLMDGGVRRGTDVLKALALGARAVLVGRSVQWGLAAGGEAGILHIMELMVGELRSAMGLSGCRSVAEASSRALLQPHPDPP